MANLTHLNQPVENHVMLISDAPGNGKFYPMFGDGGRFDVERPFRIPEGASLVVTDVFFLAHAIPAAGLAIPFRLRLKNLVDAEYTGEAFYALTATLEGAQSKHIAIAGGLVVGSRVQLVPETSGAGTIRLFGYLLNVSEGWAEAFRAPSSNVAPEEVFVPIHTGLKNLKKPKKNKEP